MPKLYRYALLRSSVAQFVHLVAILLLSISFISGADHIVEKGSGKWVVKTRLTVEFSKSTLVKNLMNWPLIVDAIPDGSLVKEGDLLVRFDRESVESEVTYKRYDLKISELNLNEKIKDIENKIKDLEDSLQEKKDRLALLQARKDQWLSIPLKKDIDKAEGEADVAKLNYDIAMREVEKSERRFEKGFVSETELLKVKDEFRMMVAEWTYAQQLLALAKKPATTSSMKKLDLEMASLNLEINKLEKELDEQALISEIQKDSERRMMAIVQQQLEDKEAELKGIELVAPSSGLVRYTSSFKRTINEGKKPRKNSTVMEIPDLTSLVLKGIVSEREGYHLNIGDNVHFFVPHLPGVRQEGVLIALSNSPRDITEGSDDWSMMGKESGIKVFEVTVQPSTLVSGLKLGMTTQATLYGSEPLEGPCVPLSHVWTDRSDRYLAIKTDARAVYKKVDGQIWENYLFLSDDSLLGKVIALHGEKPMGEAEQQEPSGFLTILGELSPSDAIDVRVPHYHNYYDDLKVSWLLEEGMEVKGGDIIARLVSEKADSKLRDVKADLEREKGTLKTFEKEMSLREQARIIDLKKSIYEVEIAKINHKIKMSSRDAQKYYSSMKDFKIQEVKLEAALRAREEMISKKTLYSPRQMNESELDLRLAQLNHRSAKIIFDQVSRGADDLDIKMSELELLRKENALGQLKINHDRDHINDERNLVMKKKGLARVKKRVRQMETDHKDFEIFASQSGILKHVKVYDGMKMSKLNPNSKVWPSQRIMSLTNTDGLLVKLDVPERYFHLVDLGLNLALEIPGIGMSSLTGKVVHRDPIFKRKKRPDTERIDMYSRQEDLGYSVFLLDIALDKSDVIYPLGSMVQVRFPFKAYP